MLRPSSFTLLTTDPLPDAPPRRRGTVCLIRVDLFKPSIEACPEVPIPACGLRELNRLDRAHFLEGVDARAATLGVRPKNDDQALRCTLAAQEGSRGTGCAFRSSPRGPSDAMWS